jgi:hypothetical protein
MPLSRRLKQAAAVFIIVFAVAQFVRPERANPATGPYTLVRPETRLSAQDVETICVAARQAEANTADGRRER